MVTVNSVSNVHRMGHVLVTVAVNTVLLWDVLPESLSHWQSLCTGSLTPKVEG